MDERTTPAKIHADRTAGTLDIDWADGHHTTYVAHDLRWLCPCAFCRGEAGLPGFAAAKGAIAFGKARLRKYFSFSIRHLAM